jgi:hypothetical protein
MALHLRVLVAFGLVAAVGAADSIIMHPPARPTELSGNDIRAMFVGRRTLWPDGRSVMVVISASGPGHDGLMRHLGKSSQQFLNGWKKLMFTGNGSMPKMLAGDQEVVAYVAQTPGAIGYIASPPPAAGVVVLLRVDATPDD